MLLAQITDLHISLDPAFLDGRIDPRVALAQAMHTLSALVPRPDVLVLTGDLTDRAEAEEYEMVRDALHRLELPAFVVPGNHDHAPTMREQLGEFMPAVDANHACYVVDDFPVSLVGLDTSVTGRAHGALDPERLAWLGSVLEQRADRPVVMFMHHPPFETGIDAMDDCGLLEGREQLAALIARHGGVLGIACGHVHRNIHTTIAGVPVVVAPSVAHQIELDLRIDAPLQYRLEPPAIALHHCQPGRPMVSHIRYVQAFPGPWPF